MTRLALVTVVATGLAAPVGAEEPDGRKLFAQCVDMSALVYGPADAKEPKPLAGALVLDAGKRLLLAPNHKVPDAPTVLFPAYTAEGELRQGPVEYADLWKKGERWKGKVLHRDQYRDLAVIELDRALPDRASAAEFAAGSTAEGATVYALTPLPPDGDIVWRFAKGEVRAVGLERYIGSPAPDEVGRRMVAATAPPGPGPGGGLFDATGRVVGVAEGWLRASLVNHSVDVTEVRAFLEEKKVPFLGAPVEKKAPAAKLPPDPQQPARDEKAAAVLLQRANIFSHDPDNKDYYMGRLREIIKKYPKTAAAAEAQKILDRMK